MKKLVDNGLKKEVQINYLLTSQVSLRIRNLEIRNFMNTGYLY